MQWVCSHEELCLLLTGNSLLGTVGADGKDTCSDSFYFYFQDNSIEITARHADLVVHVKECGGFTFLGGGTQLVLVLVKLLM